ncbi:MFS transporter, partial [Acinetobacter baumannii]|uniref:MFS transporter n=1 Tax=Acinetobacter baumannii TaxID=470 RepID=UPI000A643C45
LSDKLGRKKTILIFVTILRGITLIGAFAEEPTEVDILGFVAGLGIGGVMPNVVALVTEYAPKKISSTLGEIMLSGYAVGGMTSALLGAWLVNGMGWHMMFLVPGIPLLLLQHIWKFLAEALAFFVKSNHSKHAKSIVREIAPP